MANRGATAAVQAEWAKAQNQPAHLLELRLDAADGGTVYFSDSYRTVVWGANSYTALGHLASFSGVIESAELRIADATIELSGVDQTLIALILSKQYIDRQLLVYQMFFSSSADALVVDPFPLHDGRMDEPVMQEDPDSGKCVVQIKARDQFADFERMAGRHTNAIEQSQWFPADKAFQLMAETAARQKELMWGGNRSVLTDLFQQPFDPFGYGGLNG